MIERGEVFRIKTERHPGTLAWLLAEVRRFGAEVGEIVTLEVGLAEQAPPGSLLPDPPDRSVHQRVAHRVAASAPADA